MQAKIKYVDALRGIAVFGVISVHCSQQISGLSRSVQLLADQGARGVQLFFIMSAFTLFLSMQNRLNEKRATLKFFIRRFFRIAPLFYCAIAFYLWRDGLGSRYWLGDAPRVTWENIIATITFTNWLDPYWINSIVPGEWSIAVEMSFYLAVPYFFKKIKSLRTAFSLTLVFWISSILINYVLAKHPLISSTRLWNDFLFLWILNQMPVFCLGFVLFFLIPRLEVLKNKRRLGGIAIVLSSLLMVYFALYYNSLPQKFVFIFPITIVYGLCFLLLVIGLTLYPLKIIVNRFWCQLGTVSYSAYLCHFAILPIVSKVMNYFQLNATIKFTFYLLFAIFLTFFLSQLTYRFIEQPGQLLGKKLIKNI